MVMVMELAINYWPGWQLTAGWILWGRGRYSNSCFVHSQMLVTGDLLALLFQGEGKLMDLEGINFICIAGGRQPLHRRVSGSWREETRATAVNTADLGKSGICTAKPQRPKKHPHPTTCCALMGQPT